MTAMTSPPGRRPRIGVLCSTMAPKDGGGVRRQNVPDGYVRRVEEAGGFPILFPVADPAVVPDVLALSDGLLLVGGDDVDPAAYGANRPDLCEDVDRARDDFEFAVVRAAAEGGVPLLGICRGLQVMNVALGGTLFEDLPTRVPEAAPHRVSGRDGGHPVTAAAGSRLRALVGAERFDVNSHHHQAVARPAPRLAVVARAPDGVVEAAEDAAHPFFLGVQWHPERMETAESTRRLFLGLVRAARERARGDGAPVAPGGGEARGDGPPGDPCARG
jgi:putative glutamine amidotransferase